MQRIDSKTAAQLTPLVNQLHGRGVEGSFMTHQQSTEKHPRLMNFFLFGGLSAALWWTLYIVWVGLVSMAGELRKF
jgi:uncharacterized membrane protein